MIRIAKGKNGVPLEQLAEQHWLMINPPLDEKGNFVKRSLGDKIDTLRQNHNKNNDHNKESFYNELLRDDCALLKKIIVAPATLFTLIAQDLEKLQERLGIVGDAGIANELSKAFDYNAWRRTKGKAWFEMFDLAICPYCNISTVQYDHVKDKVNTSVDHFHDKASQPYLALSFFNLIPACSQCNSFYKTTEHFSIDTHLHPYYDNYNQEVKFTSNYIAGIKDHFIEPECLSINSLRAKNTNKDLGVGVRYNHTSSLAISIQFFELGRYYDQTCRENLLHLGRCTDEAEIETLLCELNGIPVNEEAILNTQYGKLRRDLAIQNKIIADKI